MQRILITNVERHVYSPAMLVQSIFNRNPNTSGRSKISHKNIRAINIFLHGLQDVNNTFTEQKEWEKIYSEFKQHGIITIFPIGRKGVLGNQDTKLGWCPNYESENLTFLEHLISKVTPLAPRIFLTSFSNGAFFASNLLQKGLVPQIDGFWIQGGGAPTKVNNKEKKKKIILEVGENDHNHFKVVNKLRDHLGSSGWDRSRLIFRKLACGHQFTLLNVEANLQFLLEGL